MSTAPSMLAVTMGEPAGIGGELVLGAAELARRGDADVPPFFVLDDPARLARLADALGRSLELRPIADPREAPAAWPHALPVWPVALPAPVTPGRPTPETAASVLQAIETAAELVMTGRATAMVTNPIQKDVLYRAGFTHAGHTDFLAALARRRKDARVRGPVMMMVAQDLRTVPITDHLPLKEALAALAPDRIVACARIVADALQRQFAIAAPRLAVAGLNPHAGEGGALGTEERDIIRPALDRLVAEGIDVTGPLAADSLFTESNRRQYHALLCMYHDQALIPVKTLDFWHTVNVTLGLPFIRTSPGHGTALEIAGQGVANPTSFVAALRLAARMAAASDATALAGAAP